jgi:septal ring factor EnvC (AmiA/AmiB activator)
MSLVDLVSSEVVKAIPGGVVNVTPATFAVHVALLALPYAIPAVHSKKIEQNIETIHHEVNVIADQVRERGEQRERLLDAIEHLPQELDDANQALQQARQLQEELVRDHLDVASDLVDLVALFQARIEKAKQLGESLQALNLRAAVLLDLQQQVAAQAGNFTNYMQGL